MENKSQYEESIINPKDESEMILIPKGNFTHAIKNHDKTAKIGKLRQETINIPNFYMDKYPVTNDQFCLFLNERRPDLKMVEKFIELGSDHQQRKCRIIKGKKSYQVEKGYDMYPVSHVSWYGGDEYAIWSGKRLPTSQEWEKAARGPDEILTYLCAQNYDDMDGWRKRIAEERYDELTPVDKHISDDLYGYYYSVYGCYDMGKYVGEWTSRDKDHEKHFILRGPGRMGTYNDRDGDSYICSQKFSFLPLVRRFFTGFRCCRT